MIDQIQQEKAALKHQWERQLQQARYDAHLAARQYAAVDPDNRLVAAELERRWNDKLAALATFEQAFAEAEQQARFALTPDEEQCVRALARDLPAVWRAPTTTDRDRKELLRYAIADVQLDGVTVPGTIEIRITWRSGAVTVCTVERLRVGAWAPRTDAHVVDRIRALAGAQSVPEIVAALQREGLRSAHGKPLRSHHVLYIARSRGIPLRPSTPQGPPRSGAPMRTGSSPRTTPSPRVPGAASRTTSTSSRTHRQ